MRLIGSVLSGLLYIFLSGLGLDELTAGFAGLFIGVAVSLLLIRYQAEKGERQS